MFIDRLLGPERAHFYFFEELPSDWNWQAIRNEVNPKEAYFLPFATQRKLLDAPGEGRKTLAEEAARRYDRIRQLCPEDIALRQAYKEGQLVLVESPSPYSEEEVWVDDSNADANTEVSEEITEGEWTFEPEPEKDDFTEDCDPVVEPKLEQCIQSPVELLIETFQTAKTWEEIRVAVAVREDYKH